MFSAALSMDIATLGLTGKEKRTSETATGSAMVFPCLRMLLIWSYSRENREGTVLMMNF